MSEGDLGERLKATFTGCRLQVRAIGANRSMTPEQKEKVAQLFAADNESIGGSRRVVNTQHPLLMAVTAPIRAAKKTWQTYTVEYDSKGTRLIRTDRITWMNNTILGYQVACNAAVKSLADNWQLIKDDAKSRLGELYIEEDYDFDPSMSIGIAISYPAIEPDTRLKTIAPEIYEQELGKIKQKFAEAAEQAETMLAMQFSEMVDSLLGKLTAGPGEKPKVIQSRTVEQLAEFATRFKELSVGNNDQLAGLVDRVSALAGGVDLKKLRKPGELRDEFRSKLQEAQEQLLSLAVAKPSRVLNLEE